MDTAKPKKAKDGQIYVYVASKEVDGGKGYGLIPYGDLTKAGLAISEKKKTMASLCSAWEETGLSGFKPEKVSLEEAVGVARLIFAETHFAKVGVQTDCLMLVTKVNPVVPAENGGRPLMSVDCERFEDVTGWRYDEHTNLPHLGCWIEQALEDRAGPVIGTLNRLAGSGALYQFAIPAGTLDEQQKDRLKDAVYDSFLKCYTQGEAPTDGDIVLLLKLVQECGRYNNRSPLPTGFAAIDFGFQGMWGSFRDQAQWTDFRWFDTYEPSSFYDK